MDMGHCGILVSHEVIRIEDTKTYSLYLQFLTYFLLLYPLTELKQ